MVTLSKSSKIICFLGAGASIWAGIPTFSNFHDKAKEVCNNLTDSSHEKKAFKNVLKHWENNYNDSNIEEYYSVVEMHDTLKFNHAEKADIKAKDIITVICSTIQKSIVNTDNLENYYHDLLLILFEETNYFTIITTNWDIALESEINQPNDFAKINYEGVYAYDEGLSKSERPNTEYNLLKLHGSLNWGFCKECNKIYYTDKEKCDNLHSFQEKLKCRKHNSELEPVIVPPALSKLAKTEANSKYSQLIPIWISAYKHLRSCDKIYFIGYSLPETDVETKNFISDALKGNSNLKEVVIISDKKYGHLRVNFEERYQSIISKIKSKPKLTSFDDGFELFCTEKINSSLKAFQ